MAIEEIGIKISADGTRTVQRDMSDLSDQVKSTAVAIRQLQTAITSLKNANLPPGMKGDLDSITNSLNKLRGMKGDTGSIFKGMTSSKDSLREVGNLVNNMASGFVRMRQVADREGLKTGFAFQKAAVGLTILGTQAKTAGVSVDSLSQKTKASAASVIAAGGGFKNFISAATPAAGSIQKLGSVLQQAVGNSANASSAFTRMVPPTVNLARSTSTLSQQLQNYYAVMGRGYIPMAQQLSAFRAAQLVTGNLAISFGGLMSRIFNLRNAFMLLVTQMALHSLRGYIDQWIGYENNIRLSTKSTVEAAAVEEKLFEVAQKTRMSMETAIPLYRRLAQAQVDLGATQNQMIKLTEGVGMALAIQGTSADAARGALLQLGQLLGMARVRAQEFNSINENTPRILQAVADGVKGAGGSIHVLRQMVLKGTVTNKDFFDAILKAIPQLEAEFARVTPTIGQAFTVLDNAMGRYIRSVDKATGGSKLFAESVMWIGRNLPAIIGALESLAAGFAVLASPWIWAKIAAGFAALMAASGPFGWAVLTVAAVATATVALINFGDKITLTTVKYNAWRDTVNKPLKTGSAKDQDLVMQTVDWKPIDVSVLDYIKGIWGEIKLQFTSGLNWIKNIFLELTRVIVNFVGPVLGFFVESWGQAFKRAGISTETLSTSFGDVFDAVLGWADKVLAVFNGLWDAAAQLVGGLVPLLKSIFTGENVLASVKTYGSSIGKAYVDGFNSQFVGAKGPLAQALARIQLGAEKSAIARQPTRGVANLDDPPGKRPPAVIDTSKQLKAYEHLMAQLDPVYAAIMHVVDGEKILKDAWNAGLISMQQYDTGLELLFQKYADGMHPINATIRELEEEIKVMELSSVERRGGIELMQVEAKYKKMNIPLSAQESLVIGNLIDKKQQLKYEQQELEKLYNKFTRPLQEAARAEAMLEKAMKKGIVTAEEARQELAELKMNAGTGNWADGFLVGLKVLDRQTTNWVGRIGEMFGNLTDALSSGLGEAFGRMIVYGENFSQVMGDISRQILSTLIGALVKLGIQMGLNAIISATIGAGATATSVALAGTTATAWAPAAAYVSLASYGMNAAGAMAAISTTVGLAEGLSLSLGGFMSGGFTGNLDRKAVAGVVHGQEFVVNADSTRKNRALLESINRGGTPGTPQRSSMPGGAPVVNISVHNSSRAAIDVERISDTDIRIIAREEAKRAVEQDSPRVVAAQMRDPNSRVSKSLGQSTRTYRRR